MTQHCIKCIHGTEQHGKRIGKLMRILYIILPLFISCKRTDVVTKNDFEALKTAISVQIDTQATATAKRVVPDFIGKIVLKTISEMGSDIDSLKKVDSLNLKKIEAQASTINTLRTMITRQNDSLTTLKKYAMRPNTQDFIVDSVSKILSIKRTVK